MMGRFALNAIQQTLVFCIAAFVVIFLISYALDPVYSHRVNVAYEACGRSSQCLAVQFGDMGLIYLAPHLASAALVGVATSLLLLVTLKNKTKISSKKLRKIALGGAILFTISSGIIGTGIMMFKTYSPIVPPQKKCKMDGSMDCTTKYTHKNDWKIHNAPRTLQAGTTGAALSLVYTLAALYLLKQAKTPKNSLSAPNN